MELQEAINSALTFARSALQNSKLSVEEVEFVEAPPAWRITVGYKRQLPEKQRLPPLGGASYVATATSFVDRMNAVERFAEYEDVYKTIIVPEDGSKLSMKIRKV